MVKRTPGVSLHQPGQKHRNTETWSETLQELQKLVQKHRCVADDGADQVRVCSHATCFSEEFAVPLRCLPNRNAVIFLARAFPPQTQRLLLAMRSHRLCLAYLICKSCVQSHGGGAQPPATRASSSFLCQTMMILYIF
jgi:hypothetical protein